MFKLETRDYWRMNIHTRGKWLTVAKSRDVSDLYAIILDYGLRRFCVKRNRQTLIRNNEK